MRATQKIFSNTSIYHTGQKGSRVNMTDGPDALKSQGAVAVSQSAQLVAAVNVRYFVFSFSFSNFSMYSLPEKRPGAERCLCSAFRTPQSLGTSPSSTKTLEAMPGSLFQLPSTRMAPRPTFLMPAITHALREFFSIRLHRFGHK